MAQYLPIKQACLFSLLDYVYAHYFFILFIDLLFVLLLKNTLKSIMTWIYFLPFTSFQTYYVYRYFSDYSVTCISWFVNERTKVLPPQHGPLGYLL